MHHQRGLSGGLPYDRLVTKIMEYCGIDLRDEPKKKVSSNECEINIGATGKNMGIFKDKDGLFKHKDVAHSSSSPPPIPEDDYTNEVFYNKICSTETLVTTGFRDLRLEIAQHRNQNQDEEIEDDDEDMDEDESD